MDKRKGHEQNGQTIWLVRMLQFAIESDEQGQPSVNLLHRKQFRLEVLPNPLTHVSMFTMRAVAPRLQEVLVA